MLPRKRRVRGKIGIVAVVWNGAKERWGGIFCIMRDR